MDNELMAKIKKEYKLMLILALVLIVIFKLVFFKENLVNVIRLIISLFWIFIVPGFVVMYYWHENFDFLQRLIIGSVLSAAVIGVIGYNLSLLGLHIKYSGILLPILLIIGGVIIISNKK